MSAKSSMSSIGGSALGGAWVGLGLGLCPRLGLFLEVRNFQIFLLEITYQFAGRWMPPAVMRALGTFSGELAILTWIGALIGLGTGAFFYGVVGRLSRQRGFGPLNAGIASTVGVFVFLFGVLWCRIIFIHSSSQRMVSSDGFGMVLASLAAGVIVSGAVILLLSRLSRNRLGKAVWTVAVFGLPAAYLGFFLMSRVISASPLHPAPNVKQVVFLGADGATWKVMSPMIREGKLPHLAALMKRGAWGDIRATLPWKSPVLWTSIATGKREKEHGIHDFVVRDKSTKEVKPTSISLRKVKAIWNIVSEAGLRVSVASWYASWPAEPLNGTMVSDRILSKEIPDRVFPKDRLPEIEKIVQEVSVTGEQRDELVAAHVGLYLLGKDQPDLQTIYLREIDDMQHFFWRYHAARRGSWLARRLHGTLDPEVVAEKGSRIEDAYLRLDQVLGKIVDMTGPETAIVVASDHGGGIKSLGELRFNLNPVLEQLGLLQFLPDGDEVDWSKTKVFDATLRSLKENRQFFVNKRSDGPFAQGIDEEAERQLLDLVAQELGHLKTESGKAVVQETKIYKDEEDILRLTARLNIKLNDDRSVQGKVVQLPLNKIYKQTELTGTHRLNGVMIMAGPGIKAGYRLRAASVLDMTPTLLYLLGLPVARDMEGRVLLEAFYPEVYKRKPVQTVETYEDEPFRPGGSIRKSAVDEKLMKELRSLGYL